MEIALGHYLTVAAILFTLGIFGIFLNRKNVIIILMSVELMLLAVNINLVAFSAHLGDLVGQVFAMFVLTVAAAEAAIGLAILLPIVAARRFRDVRSGNVRLQIFRNLSHFGATVGWYAAVTLLPLAEVFAIEFTTPVWTALLAVLFLGERLNTGRVAALVLGLAGILIILRPGVTAVGAGEAIMLTAAFGFAIANAATKGLTRTDSVLTRIQGFSFLVTHREDRDSNGLTRSMRKTDCTAHHLIRVPWVNAQTYCQLYRFVKLYIGSGLECREPLFQRKFP